MSTVAVLNLFYRKTATVVRPCYGRIVNMEQRSVHQNSHTTVESGRNSSRVYKSSASLFYFFFRAFAASFQPFWSNSFATSSKFSGDFLASFSAVIEQVFKRFWSNSFATSSKFSGDFLASFQAILEQILG